MLASSSRGLARKSAALCGKSRGAVFPHTATSSTSGAVTNSFSFTSYRLFFSKPKSSPNPVLLKKSHFGRSSNCKSYKDNGSGARPGKGLKNKEHVRPYVSSMTPPEELTKAVQSARIALSGRTTMRQQQKTRFQQQQQQQDSASSSWWQRAFQWYSRKLSTHPLTTKSLTGAIIAALGDVLCQAATFKLPQDENEQDKDKKQKTHVSKWSVFWNEAGRGDGCQGWDMERSFHFFLLGLVFVAPTSHYWYGGLAKHAWTRGQSFGQITKRVVLDQFVWTPVFFVIWLSSFWTLQATDDKSSSSSNSSNKSNTPSIQTQLAQHLPEVMIANWILWIPAQYINFYACPVKFQVLFCNVVELAWNAYLSFATGGGTHGHGNHAVAEETIDEKDAERLLQPNTSIPIATSSTTSTTTSAAVKET